MQPYPHTYQVGASARQDGTVTVNAPDLPSFETAAPPEFDGPGGIWSPESLLCSAVADCFVLTFRSISRAARVAWLKLECQVEGTLERVDGVAQFTRYTTVATLTVPEGTDVDKAHALLERAERGCLVSNSLRGSRALEGHIVVSPS